MPPTGGQELTAQIEQHIKKKKVPTVSKTTCPFCAKVKSLFQELGIEYKALELDQLDNGVNLQAALHEYSGQRTVPNVYINGSHIGGCDDTLRAHKEGKLLAMAKPTEKVTAPTKPAEKDSMCDITKTSEGYDYDLVVIGGGSGGLAASKEAAALGVKVACLDFVKPSPRGTTWGLGGTCVNVGCIPKKLMHQAAILGQSMEDARKFGWKFGQDVKHNWEGLKNAIQDHIGSLNWAYRVQLRNAAVSYINSYGKFVGPHKIEATDKKGKVKQITSKYFIIATGGRPRYPEIPGALEYSISSDDLFKLEQSPGKTLVVGASYVALECAGFLAGMGLEVVVMVRSILLRGFDQQCAEKIGEYMHGHKIKFLRPCVPNKIEQLKAPKDSTLGKYKVTGTMNDGQVVTVECNTVMFAVGRDPCTKDLNLESVGVKVNPKTGFVIGKDDESTTCPYVYGVGDILEGRPELTPVAIQAGRLLAQRLFNKATLKCDYDTIPTTVFTPIEYGCIGLAEEDAIKKFGEQDLEIYHSNFWPLEWTVAQREENACYIKLICVKSQKERVVGFHVLGPNAGEITQGWALGMKKGATKAEFDNCIGIHPTCSEHFTTLEVTKSSGADATTSGC